MCISRHCVFNSRLSPIVAALLGLAPMIAVAQTDIGSLPRVSAPGAYGDSPTTGVTAASSTQRALSPPPGVGSEAATGFSMSIGLGMSRHSNPERIGDDSESDTSYVVTPSLRYGGELGRHGYEIGYSAGSESYQDFDTEDSDYQRLGGALRLDLTRILIADIYASRTEAEEQRGTSGSREIGVNEDEDEYTYDTVGGRITLGRRSNLLQLYVGAEANSIEFTNNNQGIRDRDEDLVEAGLFFNVGAATALFLHVTETDIDYLIGNPSLDNTETTVTGGVTWEPTAAISVLLEAGQLEKEYDDPAIEGFDGSTYLAKIRWSPRDRTSLSLYTSRRTEESSFAGSSFYVSEVSGVDVSQQLGNRASVTLHYAVADDEYSDGRQDDITDYGIAFGYSVFDWMDLGLSYNIVDRESTDVDDDYEDEIVSLFVNIKPYFGGSE